MDIATVSMNSCGPVGSGDLNNDDEENLIEVEKKSKLGNSLRIFSAFGSSALVIVATFQSITHFSAQKLLLWHLAVVCALSAAVHIFAFLLLSRTNLISAKTRFLIGCLTSALSTVALVPTLHSALVSSILTLTAQRVIQELGFAFLLHALPALLRNEIPSSTHFLIPLLVVVRGFATFMSPLALNFLNGLSAWASSAFVCVGFSVLLVLGFFIFNSTSRTHSIRSSSPNPNLNPTLHKLFVVLLAFNNATTISTLSLLSDEIFGKDHDQVRFVLWLVLSGILYFLAGPAVAISIRCLPPRGFVLLISTTLSTVLLVSLNFQPTKLVPITSGLLAASNGGQIVLLHMHLAETFSSNMLHRQHDVIAGRLISMAFSLSCITSFLFPPIFKFLSPGEALSFKSVYPCVVSNVITLLTILFYITIELCTS